MKKTYLLGPFFLLLILHSQCQQEQFNKAALDKFSQGQQIKWNKDLTKVMVTDIFTPPVCSRIYAYPNIAAYEVMAIANPKYKSLATKLRDLTAPPTTEEEYYWPMASIVAFAVVAEELVYGKEIIDSVKNEYLNEVQNLGIPQKLYQQSLEYGEAIGQHIIQWAESDGYLQRTAKPQYSILEGPGKWKPTPPDYMPAIEPHWNTIRLMVLDSTRHFPSLPHTAFDTKEQSLFYKETIAVYEAVKNLDEEKTNIAKFWDCNPNVSNTKGHLMFFDQKISPGGHWMSIAGIALNKNKASIEETAKVLAMTSVTLFDAFIACWEEKYSSSLIRPETYINEYIDPDWKPLLQTPAFPEYTSGHSVISTAAAELLTDIFGDHFSFHDDTEVPYGLPARDFTSFRAAASEAAISRLYGGIHYMPAIENGVEQGRRLGNYITKELKDIQ